MNEPLLIELFTEELPPKALARLGESFAATIVDGLRAQGLAPAGCAVDVFATPRRLAVRVADVRDRAEDRAVEAKGPSVAVGLDAAGQPTLALRKWADKQGAAVEGLVRATDGKQECFFYRSTAAGATLAQAVHGLRRCGACLGPEAARKVARAHAGASRQRVDAVVCLQLAAHLLEQGAEAALRALQIQQR